MSNPAKNDTLLTPDNHALLLIDHQYLQLQRLLASGGEALSDIAVSLGFYDQSHFTRTFRKATGLTPLAYARRARSDAA